MRLFIAICLLILSLSGGQSLVIPTSGSTGTFTYPTRAYDADFRLEFQIHDLGANPSPGREMFWINGLGLRISRSNLSAVFVDIVGDTVTGGSFWIEMTPGQNKLVRIQRDYPSAYHMEVWDVGVADIEYQTRPITAVGEAYSATGGSIYSVPHNGIQFGFLRVFSTLVDMDGLPPLTAATGDLLDFKFDGDTQDTSGNGYHITGGTYDFEDTPGQTTYSIIQQPDKPSWAPFKPMRAGHLNQLTSISYSMADVGSDVTCLWLQTEGPSTALFADRTSCTAPGISGLVFGQYVFRLAVTDAAGQRATSDFTVGSVAYDDNGVVIYPDERLYDLLGPAKVYTENDWEWVDERWTEMAQANWNKYEVNGGPWLGEGSKTTLQGIAREGTISATNGSGAIVGSGSNLQEVFCNGGTAPLPTVYGNPYMLMRTASGAVRSGQVNGCTSETAVTIANWPYPTESGMEWRTFGFAQYRWDGTGTMYTDAGQPTKVFGVGTNFQTTICNGGSTPPNGTSLIALDPVNGYSRRTVVSCQSETEITMSESWSDFTASPGFAWAYEDGAAFPGLWTANASTTVNYYDVALAHYALYYRSGWGEALEAARFIADAWYSTGPIDGKFGPFRSHAWAGLVLRHLIDTEGADTEKFWPRLRQLIGAAFDTGLCGSEKPIGELREDSYCVETVALVAKFDPDEEQRAEHIERLQDFVDNWQPQQKSEGEFWNQYATGDLTRVVTLANGSATVTKHSGPDFTADYCGPVASFNTSGTISGTTGSTAITGSGTSFLAQVGKTVFLRGTLDGQPYSQVNRLQSASSNTAGTLRYPLALDTITAFRFQTFAGASRSAFAFSMLPVNSSGALLTDTPGGYPTYGQVERDAWYWCTVDSGTQLTLDRPYTGDTTNIYRRMATNGPMPSQPFVHAITGQMLHRVAKALDGTDSARAATARSMAEGVRDYLDWAEDGYSYGVPYYTHSPQCLPRTPVPNICGDDGDGSIGTVYPPLHRSYAVESHRMNAWDYLANPTPEKLTRGDAWYTAHFAKSGYDAPTEGDGYTASLLETSSYSYSDNLLTKNYGQTFGVGGAAMWPAARLGGESPAQLQTYLIALTLPAGAVDALVTKYLPNGATAAQVCSSFPCTLTGVDVRAGGPAIFWTWRDAGGNALGSSSLYPIQK